MIEWSHIDGTDPPILRCCAQAVPHDGEVVLAGATDGEHRACPYPHGDDSGVRMRSERNAWIAAWRWKP